MEQEKNKAIFETMPVPSALRTMALPTIISQLIILIYNMADTFYLGRTNNPFMVAGVSLILPVFNICLSLSGLAGVGGGALISRLLGAGDAKEAEKVSAFSIYLAVITTAVFSAGMLLFMNPILRLLGASGNTLAYAYQYSFCVIVLKAERLPLNVGLGICQGMMPLVAYNYSSGDRKRMFKIIRFSLVTGLVVGVFSVAMYEVLAGSILRLFIADPETVRLGTGFLRIRCLATPLMFMSFFTVFTFQGFGRGEQALFLGIMRWAAFNIPMLFVLNHVLGMYGIVWSQVTADSLTVMLSAFVYFSFKRRLIEDGT